MKHFCRFFSASLLLFTLSSCVKDKDLIAPPPVRTEATSFATIQAATDFSWTTSRKINFTFTGASKNDYQQVLKIVLPDGSTAFRKLQPATEDFTGSIEIPSHVNSITLQFGDVEKTFDVRQGAINITVNE